MTLLAEKVGIVRTAKPRPRSTACRCCAVLAQRRSC